MNKDYTSLTLFYSPLSEISPMATTFMESDQQAPVQDECAVAEKIA
jgi:hypothetical protein